MLAVEVESTRRTNYRSAAAAFHSKDTYDEIKQSGNAICYRSTRYRR